MSGRRNARWARRAVLGALLLGAAVLLRAGPPQVCRDAVAPVGAVSVCEPVPIADLRVGLFLLVVALLLLPEVGELQLAGLLTIKARVAEARADAAEARREVAELRAVVSSSAGAAAAASANVYLVDRATATGDAVAAAWEGAHPVTADQAVPSIVAFRAAFEGLRSLLPEWARDAAVIAFTLNDDGAYVEHATSRAGGDERAACAAVLPGLGARAVAWSPERHVVATRVEDGDGNALGAIAVHLRGAVPAGQTLAVRPDELNAALELLSLAYSCLLLDLLSPPRQHRHNEVAQ